MKHTADNTQRRLEAWNALVDRELRKILRGHKNEPKEITAALSYTTLSGGKRLRPLFAIAVYDLLGGKAREIVGPACALELIHSGSLMLDDLPSMDNARNRRGKKAHHLVFGEATTVLASIALLAAAFETLSRVPPARMHSLIESTARTVGRVGLIRGQFLDLNRRKEVRTIGDLERLYYLKTGILFENAAHLGALMGGATGVEQKRLEKIGRDFGFAFQVRDDIVDAEWTAERAGKDVRTDAKRASPSAVGVLGIPRAKALLLAKIETMRSDLQKIGRNAGALRDMIETLEI